METERIPYEAPELIKHKHPLLNDGSNFIGIVGHSGSGKTMILRDLVPMFYAQCIILCSVVKFNPVHLAIFLWAKARQIRMGIYNSVERADAAVSALVQEYQAMEPEEQKQFHNLLVSDDFTNYQQRREDRFNNFLIKAFSLLRNMNFSMVCVTQDYSNIPTLVRSNLRIIIIFAQGNHHGLTQLKLDLKNNLSTKTIEAFIIYMKKHYAKYCDIPSGNKKQDQFADFYAIVTNYIATRKDFFPFIIFKYPSNVYLQFEQII